MFGSVQGGEEKGLNSRGCQEVRIRKEIWRLFMEKELDVLGLIEEKWLRGGRDEF